MNQPQFAQSEDILILVNHHRLMFEEIYQINNIKTDSKGWEAMDEAYGKKLDLELPVGTCMACGIKIKNRMISSGAITFASMVPLPEDPTSTTAFIHSIYTEPKHRKNGYSKLVLTALIQACKLKGVKRIRLSASEAGLSMYKQFGFKMSNNAMSLFLTEGEE